ncbi:hypothetical protein [Metabacillus sp. Hm71]|uniref:hypothetical protein n=1 Tax=Metabacillus sp. Hm71 TaxID=3450743 RepID=UPI003F442979
MYKELKVYDRDQLKNGLPVKVSRRGMSNTPEYGIIKSCSLEVLEYYTLTNEGMQTKELHLSYAVQYG